MRRFRASLLVMALWGALSGIMAGCGGGGGGGGSTPARTAVPHVIVRWSERSRNFDGLSSALSARVTLKKAHPNGSDIAFVVNRNLSTAAHSETYNAPEAAKVGAWDLNADLYSDVGGVGTKVGMAAGRVTMDVDGNLPPVATVGFVASVEITPDQTLPVNQTRDLSFSIRDVSGALLGITPGSLLFAVQSGQERLQFASGRAEGLLPGPATVTATVDGITSAPVSLNVTSNTVVTVTPSPVTVALGGTVNFQATVTNAPVTSVRWTIAEGAAGGSISPTGVYTAPTTAGVYNVIVTSQYDPGKQVIIPVTVPAGGGIIVGGEFPDSGGATVIID